MGGGEKFKKYYFGVINTAKELAIASLIFHAHNKNKSDFYTELGNFYLILISVSIMLRFPALLTPSAYPRVLARVWPGLAIFDKAGIFCLILAAMFVVLVLPAVVAAYAVAHNW